MVAELGKKLGSQDLGTSYGKLSWPCNQVASILKFFASLVSFSLAVADDPYSLRFLVYRC